MQSVLRPIEQAAPFLENVRIDEEVIGNYAATIRPGDLDRIEFRGLLDLEPHGHIASAFVYNAVNFSYWGNPKWTIDIDGQQHDGGAAMLQALRRGIGERYDLLKPAFLAELDRPTLATILRGNIEIPLFEARLNFLNQLGRHLAQHYEGSFTNFVETARWDSELLVTKLVTELPEVFDDTSTYRRETVHFYKRAQLVPAHLHDLYRLGDIPQAISGYEQLTAFADYKVPQFMRRLGILAYSATLAAIVDSKTEIAAGSQDELEIRIATVWANELCTRAIRRHIPQATAAQVDCLFWFAGQHPNENMLPYHQTRTTKY